MEIFPKRRRLAGFPVTRMEPHRAGKGKSGCQWARLNCLPLPAGPGGPSDRLGVAVDFGSFSTLGWDAGGFSGSGLTRFALSSAVRLGNPPNFGFRAFRITTETHENFTKVNLWHWHFALLCFRARRCNTVHPLFTKRSYDFKHSTFSFVSWPVSRGCRNRPLSLRLSVSQDVHWETFCLHLHSVPHREGGSIGGPLLFNVLGSETDDGVAWWIWNQFNASGMVRQHKWITSNLMMHTFVLTIVRMTVWNRVPSVSPFGRLIVVVQIITCEGPCFSIHLSMRTTTLSS